MNFAAKHRRQAHRLAAVLLLLAAPVAATEAVDLELVLAIDVSRSIDYAEARLQREGTAAALRNPEVIRAIKSGILRRIAVTYLDYSSTSFNNIIAGWTIIDSEESARAFAQKLTDAELTFGRRTSISSAIEIGMEMIENNAIEGTRRVIDISGDGPNNAGTLVDAARDIATAKRITINGLPIIDNRDGFGPGARFALADLDKYYQGCVIGGPGAFLVVARNFKDFARAIRRKLVFEIAGVMPAKPQKAPLIRVSGQAALTALRPAAYTYPDGCDVGERIWERIWGGQFFDDN